MFSKILTEPFTRTIINGFFTLKSDWLLSWSFLSAVPEDLSSEYNKWQSNKIDYSILKLAFSFWNICKQGFFSKA